LTLIPLFTFSYKSMPVDFNIAEDLENKIKFVASQLDSFDSSFSPDVKPADPRFGDFQANGVLPFAKSVKKNPRELATELVNAFKAHNTFPDNVVQFDIAGPGFINFKLSPLALFTWLRKYKTEADFKHAAGSFHKGKTITIDYSSPNTAKQMHVGHLRSMVIGEALKRLLSFCGARVIGDNHIGDWGTQFGILIMAIHRFNYDLNSPHADVLEDLEGIYQRGTALFNEDPSAKAEAHQALVKLQKGDEHYLAIWQKINDVSYKAFEEIYNAFNVKFDIVMGESCYRNDVDRIYKELEETGVAVESEGALVVFHPREDQDDYPFIVRKTDGASNYASTDLATILHHANELHADEMVYVTDGRQQDHFKYLYLTAEKWFNAMGYTNLPKYHHTWFGSILGEDGKAIKTRAGKSIKLKELVKEAIDRAFAVVTEKNPDLSEDERHKVAKVVGIGALRYADLSQNRTHDYVFSWEKLLSFDGNTAPYLLYAIARIYSIFRKLDLTPGDFEDAASPFETEKEIELARKLLNFPIALQQAIADFRPHFICTYLFELAGCFSSFYNADKVIVEDNTVKSRRLLLCARTLSVLETGLHLLGLETLKKM